MTGEVHLLRLSRRFVLTRGAGGCALGVVGVAYSIAALRGGAEGMGRALALLALPCGVVMVLGAAGVVVSNLMQEFAVVKAVGSEVVLVYPFGLHRVFKSSRFRCEQRSEIRLRRLDTHGALTTFRIEGGGGVIETRLGAASLEEDFEERFAARAAAWAQADDSD